MAALAARRGVRRCEALLSVEAVLNRIIWGQRVSNDAAQRSLEMVSLFDWLGLSGRVKDQGEYVARELAGIPEDTVVEHVRSFRTRGIVVQRGDFLQVQPIPLAVRLASQRLTLLPDGRLKREFHLGVTMISKFAAACILAALVFWAEPAAADDCRKVNLDDQLPSAPIGVQPNIKNLGPGEVYISLASAPVKDLSANPSDLYRVTGFVLGPGDAVGSRSGHIVASVDNSPYVVQLAKRNAAATVEICVEP